MKKKVASIFAAIWLSACGGGGNDGSQISTPTTSSLVSTAKSVNFSPSKVALNYEAGSSSTFSVTATVANPKDFAGASQVYAFIIDDIGVINTDVNIVDQHNGSYVATFHTSPSIAAGHYQGNFTLKLCPESACISQFPGSPALLPFDIQVLPANAERLAAASVMPLSASMHLGAGATVPATVSVTGNNLKWVAKSDARWVKLTDASGTGGGSFKVAFDPAGLVAGDYSDTVVVTSADGQSVSLPVTLTMLPTEFQITSSGVSFSAINGAPIKAQSLSFDLNNNTPTGWTATTSAPWLSMSPSSGTTPAVSTLSVDPSVGPLASGTYTAQGTLSSPGITSKTLAVNLNLVKASLTSNTTDLVFGGGKGRDFSDQSLTLSLNTQDSSWPWSMAGLPVWAGANNTAGSINQSGSTVKFSALSSQVGVGTRTAVFNVTAKVNGDSVALPITATFHKDQHRILALETGVAFASTPVGLRLSRAIPITDNFGKSTSWAASSDQAWLSVTPSGTTGNGSSGIVLNADPSSLPANTISYATVTITAADSTIPDPEKIKVALWKDTVSSKVTTTLPGPYAKIFPDPIRPYVYAHNGGGSIDVYNLYTATKIKTIANMGASLGNMAISPDGSLLYALDTASRKISVADLSSLSQTSTWPLDNAVGANTTVTVIRPNGVGVILVGDGTAYATEGGRRFGATGISGLIAASADGKKVFSQDMGISPSTVASFDVDYSEMSGGVLMIKRLVAKAQSDSQTVASNGKDIAVSEDGARLYTASGAPYRCRSLDPTDLSLIGDLPGGDTYPNNVKVGSDGRVFCGISGGSTGYDFWTHDANGVLLDKFKITGYSHALLDRQLVVSGDGLVAIALTNDPIIAFVRIGP